MYFFYLQNSLLAFVIITKIHVYKEIQFLHINAQLFVYILIFNFYNYK